MEHLSKAWSIRTRTAFDRISFHTFLQTSKPDADKLTIKTNRFWGNHIMNRVAHIFPYEKFTQSYINFIMENFIPSEHLFIVWASNPDISLDINQQANICYTDQLKNIASDKKLFELLRSSSKVILHGIFDFPFFLEGQKELLKKLYIVFWGSDLYCFRKMPRRPQNIFNRMYRKYIIRNCHAVATLTAGDYDVLQKYVGFRGKHFLAAYINDDAQLNLLHSLIGVPKSKNPIRILVGNSATDTNNHMEAFEMLSKFKDEDIQVICPLSYGDPKYKDRVIEAGERTFGPKFIALTDLMPFDQYVKLLASCAVGVFNNNRQQAMGNIFDLLLFGAKVYLRTDTTMYEMFIKERDYRCYDIQKVKDLPFSDFLSIPEKDISNNQKNVSYYISPEYACGLWRQIFDDETRS